MNLLLLLVALEALILAVFCFDLGSNFHFLPQPGRVVLVLLAAAAVPLLHYTGPRLLPSRRWRDAFIVFAAGTVIVGVLGAVSEWRARVVEAEWVARGEERLGQRARVLQEDFSWFLDEMVRPLASFGPEMPEIDRAFAMITRAQEDSRLPGPRYGVALHGADGEVVAWGGNSTPPPVELLRAEGPGPVFAVVGGDLSPRLYASVVPAGGGARWVAEFLLKPPPTAVETGIDSAPRLDFLPRWESVAPAHIQLHHDPRQAEEIARFFGRHGDRHWSRQGRQGLRTLAIPLRSAAGDPLAVVTLRERRVGSRVAELHAAGRRAASVLMAGCLLVASLLMLSRGARLRGLAVLAIGTAGIWSVRGMLLLIGGAASLPRLALYDITVYSSSALGGLLRSPADLLLTTLACLAQAWLVRHYLDTLPLPGSPGRRRVVSRFAAGGLLLLAAAGALGTHELLDQMVLDSRLDISRVTLDERLWPRLALQGSLFVLVAGLAVVLIALLDLALRCRGRENTWLLLRWFRAGSSERLPLVLRATAGVFLLTLLYVPFLQHSYERLRRAFFEKELVPRVMYQAPRRLEILNDTLLEAGDPDFAVAASFALEERESGSGIVAYRLWATTPMAHMGLASSLQIYDRDGRLLSRFAVNFAPMLEVPFAAARDAAGSPARRLAARADRTVQEAIVFGSRWVGAPHYPELLVVMSLVDDFNNVPMFGAETTFLPLLRGRTLTRTNPELARYDPMLAVFGPGFNRLYESGGEIPPPGPGMIAKLEDQPVVWRTDGMGEGPARIAYFRGSGEIYALAYAQPGLFGRVAAFLRLGLLNGVLAAVLFALLGGGYWVTRRRLPRLTLGTTFYGRLTAVFLLTALVPLLALAYFVTRFSEREFDRELTTSGLSSLQVARRVIEDYLAVSGQDEAATLDDDVVFWLGRVVRQDINVFQAATLLASSSRELYASALLNMRLNGDVYRAVAVNREPFWQAEERLGDLEYLTLSAPMRINRAGTVGIISIPLAAHRRAVARKIEQVEDAVLISTCLTVILLAAVGWLVARRISDPIARLARAARRVEEGDLEVRVTTSARGEIGALVSSFNRMAGSLRGQREDLRRRKDYIEKILTSATTGVISLGSDGTLITINPAAQNLLTCETGPLKTGDRLQERLALEPSLAPLGRAVAGAMEGNADQEVELVLRKGGGELRLRAVFLPFTPEAGAPPGRIVLLEDVTEIVRSGRLAAWAEMARRIAHEVKNPLTPILLSVEHVRRVWRAGDERFGTILSECLDNIQKQVGALRQIASEFSAYARLPELRTEPLPVRAIVEETLAAYASAPPPGVVLRSAIAADLPLLLVDRAVMVRALVNLVENALQAMPDGGTLSIEAAVTGGPDGTTGVRIDVRDSGVGMAPEVLARLFEPYFSTKTGGTGLGLAIARKAVEEHGGTLKIDSRPGEGTVVSLVLPAGTVAASRDTA